MKSVGNQNRVSQTHRRIASIADSRGASNRLGAEATGLFMQEPRILSPRAEVFPCQMQTCVRKQYYTWAFPAEIRSDDIIFVQIIVTKYNLNVGEYHLSTSDMICGYCSIFSPFSTNYLKIMSSTTVILRKIECRQFTKFDWKNLLLLQSSI